MKILRKLSSSVFLCCTLLSYAQYTEVINSNRPGNSKSAFSVGVNVLQLEVGPYYQKDKHSLLFRDDSSFGIDFSTRYGLFWEQLELNIEGTFQSTKRSFTNSVTNEENFTNFKQLSFGAKYLIYDPYKKAGEYKPNIYSWKANRRFRWRELIPAVSVYVGGNYDTKNNPFTAQGVEGFSPRAMLATQNNFSGGWVLVTNFLMDRIGSKQSDFQYIFTLTKSISTKWVVFMETQGISSDFYADNLFRFGGAYLFHKDFQIDTAITLNTKDTPSVFNVNLGLSYRFDFHQDKIPQDETTIDKKKSKKKKKSKRNKDREKREKQEIEIDFND